MRKLVRVTDPDTGHQFTTSEAHAKRVGLTVTTKDATDPFGAPLAGKANINPPKATRKAADNQKEA